MAKTPIIVVAGQAGSGKDTVGAFIKENYNTIALALADPMKRLTRDAFGFTDEQLWGPSECRNAVVPFEELSSWNFGNSDALKFVAEMGLPLTAAESLNTWIEDTYKKAKSDKGTSARVVLQTLGTEWGRKVSPTMWVDYALKAARRLLSGNLYYSRSAGIVEDHRTNCDYVVITDGRFRNEIVGVASINGVALHVTGRTNAGPSVGIVGHQSEKELDGIPSHFYDETIVNDQGFQELYDQVADAMAVNYGDSRGHERS